MATRNRTPIYRKYREALLSFRSPSAAPSSSGSGGGGPVIELVSTSLLRSDRPYAPLSTEEPGTSSGGALTIGLPPAWVDVSEEISVNIQRARTKMSELVKAHAKALMPSFGDEKGDQHAIEALTREITELLRISEKRIKNLSSSESSEDSGVRKNVQRSLATDLQNLSVDFRKKQSTYLKRLQLQKEDSLDLEINMNGTGSRKDDDDFDDVYLLILVSVSSHCDLISVQISNQPDTVKHIRRPGFISLYQIYGLKYQPVLGISADMHLIYDFDAQQMSKLKKGQVFTRERESEIIQVVESVNELAQIMKDLSVLVIDQGTIVDRIDHNIQNVVSSVEQGYKQLEKAERAQSQGGMVTCVIVLVILCFIMLVLLILKTILF